jgi:hypothetical protein
MKVMDLYLKVIWKKQRAIAAHLNYFKPQGPRNFFFKIIPESHFSVQKFDEVFIGKKYGEEFRHFF